MENKKLNDEILKIKCDFVDEILKQYSQQPFMPLITFNIATELPKLMKKITEKCREYKIHIVNGINVEKLLSKKDN